jgi:hypothetical protein
MNATETNRKLNDHIRFNKGTKTVCVSTCLNYFGISPNSYNYTSSKKNRNAYENVLRKFGYSVRSRKSEFKIQKYNQTTMTQLKSNVKKSTYTNKDLFIVDCVQRKSAHLIIINGEGEIIIDTAPNMRWRIRSVKLVTK